MFLFKQSLASVGDPELFRPNPTDPAPTLQAVPDPDTRIQDIHITGKFKVYVHNGLLHNY